MWHTRIYAPTHFLIVYLWSAIYEINEFHADQNSLIERENLKGKISPITNYIRKYFVEHCQNMDRLRHEEEICVWLLSKPDYINLVSFLLITFLTMLTSYRWYETTTSMDLLLVFLFLFTR